ncbi:hypothetical protein AHIS2_p042 [Acaryochloris phage A-HIS2]|nr:hypothetical protein AHIS2_p042 [Acaryochloris phage A-HIS2]
MQLTAAQIATLKEVGLLDADYHTLLATEHPEECPSYECLLWLSQAIFGDHFEDDQCNKDFDAILDAFDERFNPEWYEKACMCLDCA